MNEFVVQPSTEGEFQIVRFEPVVVARCLDQAMAITIAGMLNGQACGAEPVSEAPEETDAPATDPEPQPQEAAAPVEPTPADWTEAELEQAFDALWAGEKLRAVADRFGKSWTSLRGRWAGHLSAMKNKPDSADKPEEKNEAIAPASTALVAAPVFKSAYNKTVEAITDLKDQATCTMCGRHFKPTPDQLDCCARCSADV